ncbi:ShlB/FhaC/HecB family hemolysin secretion/activation protein [Anabaena sp. CA = ATCC 33047]|uniref:ShlB/FhaC/HecB family hemolysin secretion/activation protein n=2 Tax=unclassified Anabaena TaxID=2619674 RepID=UPI000832ACB3|nr:ShlB/FhaC/HecB family hemolysin secretion/activation protein [Anabaena sp. CA = ATCC 33047]
MSKGKKIGIASEVHNQSRIANFAFRCVPRVKNFNFHRYQSSLLLMMPTLCLFIVNGQRSLASNNPHPVPELNSHQYLPTTTIVQAADATPPEPESQTQSPPATETPILPEKFYVRQIQVVGSTVFNQNDFAPIVKPFEARELTVEEMRKAADAVTQLYLNENYLNSRAIPITPQPGTTDGVLVLQVIEGRLAEIDIQGAERVNPAYIRSRIQLGAGVPLNGINLEEQLRLLRLDPLFTNVEASLRPTGKVGESLLIVRVQEAQNFTSNFLIDNYSPPSVGGERFGVELAYRNLTGFGDLFTGSYYRTFTGGSEVWDFSYQMPVNAMNGTVQVRVSPSSSNITESPFRELNIQGEQDLYEINYRQPLWRTTREEFALSLGFTYQDGQSFLFFGNPPVRVGIGPGNNGVSRTSVIKFAQDYVKRDLQGAWFLRSQFNLGVGLFDATINQDPIPDSRFFSWLGQIQRSQQLNNDNLLLIQADWQLTPNSLLPSQQFVIGGGQSIRGYRQNIRAGDNGFRLGVENRIVVQRNEAGLPTMQLAPFFDLGVVWNQADNPNKLPEQTFLAGAGLGLLWNQALGIERLSMRLDYAIPFVDLQGRGNNIQDEGFYFSLRYQP